MAAGYTNTAGEGAANYLDNFSVFTTMTPSYYQLTYPSVYIYDQGQFQIYFGATYNLEPAVRPVINLKADVEFTGNGESGTPYEVVME